jgi:hypothetical protein
LPQRQRARLVSDGCREKTAAKPGQMLVAKARWMALVHAGWLPLVDSGAMPFGGEQMHQVLTLALAPWGAGPALWGKEARIRTVSR